MVVPNVLGDLLDPVKKMVEAMRERVVSKVSEMAQHDFEVEPGSTAVAENASGGDSGGYFMAIMWCI